MQQQTAAPNAASSPAATSAPLAASAPAAPRTPPVVPPGLKPFNEVIAGAKRIDGIVPVWVKDDKYWLELRPELLGRPLYFAIQHTQGMGERGLWAGMMGGAGLVEFRHVSERIQLLALNTNFEARGSAPLERGVAQGFPQSLLSIAAVASQPASDSHALLVDASQMLLVDIPAMASRLEGVYRQGYAFERGNSAILSATADAQETRFDLRAHFVVGRIALPAPGQSPAAPLPGTAPDARSLLLGFHYSFSKLPDPVMKPRVADPRVGYFNVTRWDFSNDLAPSPRVRHIRRWRLEKKDPAAPISEPVQPIVFWIDRNVPERYRDTVREGILMWNAAFEKIGYRDAIVVRQQAEDADWTTLDRQHASVRWFLSTDSTVAFGPTHVDPRSGEILDADIMVSESWTRYARGERSRNMPLHLRPIGFGGVAEMPDMPVHAHGDTCIHAEAALDQLHWGLDALEPTGQATPGSPETERFVRDVLRNVVAHEIGHALGLAHNFRASSAYTPAQLRDAEFVARNGVSASIMDYVPTNIGLRNELPVDAVQRTLGPYDFWAIEYGYREFAPGTESDSLANIAVRGEREPQLAYGDDFDASSVDPAVARFDLGNDPRAWFERQLAVTRELWDWLGTQAIGDIARYAELRPSVERSLGMLSGGAANLSRVIGGVSVARIPSATDRAPLAPVPARTQRAALDSLSRSLFSNDSLRLPPALLARLVPDFLERGNDSGFGPQLPLQTTVLRMQQGVLDRLFSEQVAQRLLEAEWLMPGNEPPLRIAELHKRLQRDIWSELRNGQLRDIPLARRNLQRAHLARLAALIARPSAGLPADARSLARATALRLQQDIAQALKRPLLSAETRAHLGESQAVIDETLRAVLQKVPS